MHEILKRLDIERLCELPSQWSANSCVKMEARWQRALVEGREFDQ
jgi:hypothetical protein